MIDRLDCDILMPSTWSDFFERRGRLRAEFNDERRFARWHFRNRAILKHDAGMSTVYTKDVSREGLSFVHSRQLFPRTDVLILLPSGLNVHLVVARCLRVQDRCYECGGRAASADDQAVLEKVLRQLIADAEEG